MSDSPAETHAAALPVLRVQVWEHMDDTARRQLMSRGTSAIFDPALRVSINKIIDDAWFSNPLLAYLRSRQTY